MNPEQDNSEQDIPDNLLTQRLADAGFSTHDIRNILEIIGSVCPYCQNADCGCQCWNDE